ncbi:response regulator transcription factor [Paraflavitalea speifideaquila]|uniref:response regulator transcription factor n=1 Tax=Paraflavitalea speifideaquila TaxID=3076558 RepID=UPI0028E48C92|nr:response regulator transcription factor [Paraflavitalea speifideiaquila]
MIRVAAIEDSKLYRDKLQVLLSDSELVRLIHCLESCHAITDAFTRSLPDVVIMDIGLPGINGIEGVRIIKKKWPGLQVIMFTVHEDEDKIFEAIKAGANGYLLKGNALRLISAIEEVMTGDVPLSSGIARKLLEHFREEGRNEKQLMDANLTRREEEILQYLMKGQSYKQIANAIHIQVETLNSHIKNIYRKLDVHSKAKYPPASAFIAHKVLLLQHSTYHKSGILLTCNWLILPFSGIDFG